MIVHLRLPDTIYLHCFCGAFVGVLATVVAHPIDVIKTRMMSSPDAFTSLGHCIKTTFVEGGFRGFYNGFIANCT